jgi:hypothetical protein
MEEHQIGWIAAIIIGGIAGWRAAGTMIAARCTSVQPLGPYGL